MRSFLFGFWLVALATAAPISYAADQLTTATHGDWIALNGTVKVSSGDAFLLDFGSGSITVEVDDFDKANENIFRAGDKVTVVGKVEDRTFDSRTIEAHSVYSGRTGTVYSSAVDEEYAFSHQAGRAASSDENVFEITGTLVSRTGNQLLLNVGSKTVKIDVAAVKLPPDIRRGDRLRVFGIIDQGDLFERREFDATAVVVIRQV